VADFLDQKRGEITKRLNELKPLVEEYHRLEAAAAALEGVSGQAAPSISNGRRRGPGRPRGAATSTARKATTRRAGRKRGSGTRAAQALTLVQDQPGITIPELAKSMGIKQNYLYRVLPGLEQDGKVARKGRGWHPTSK
jgi:hypothetical protein